MFIDSDTIVSFSEANQNFLKVARIVDQYGSVTIMKNNTPRYILIDFNKAEKIQNASKEYVFSSSEKFIQKNEKINLDQYSTRTERGQHVDEYMAKMRDTDRL